MQGSAWDESQENIDSTIELFKSLGFVVHQEKSVLSPQKKLRCFGFCLNSADMTVTLPEEEAAKIKAACVQLKRQCNITIRELAEVRGQLVAVFHVVVLGPLYRRDLEHDKATALKMSEGSVDALFGNL